MASPSPDIIRLLEVDATAETTGDADTAWSPAIRPEVLAGPEQRMQRRQVEAALFGAQEAVPYGRYRLLNRLGEGGMGVVYAAYDEHLERKIALKLIRPSRLDGAEARERTLREARALARLSHPNVVHVYEVGELEGQMFVAMEFLAGPTLHAWLKGQVRPWRETLRRFCQAGEGLAAAHAQGIIHRDFKPQNAMLGGDGRVRVLDFGLARFGASGEAGARADAEAMGDARGLTMTGAVLGTPAYMAPEQFMERRASERSDQFSFCVALFEALHGYRPFQGETIAGLMEAVGAGLVAARPQDSAVPQRIHAVLLRGLKVDPEARWPSMHDLLVALEREPGARLRRTLAAVTLVAGIGAAGHALTRPNEVVAAVCPDARLEIAEIWGEARAAGVRAAVRAKHGVEGDALLAVVEPHLERYAAQWSAMRDAACLAHAEGRQSAHVFDLRTACLDQRRAGFDAVVQLLDGAGELSLADIAGASSAVPALARCEDTQALLAAIAPPEDPAMAARVQAHRETLARAQVHEDAGQYAPGTALVATVLADEAALAHEPLRAEAYLLKGALEMFFDSAGSLRSLERALWTALACGHAPVAAQASSKRGYLHSTVLSRHDQAMTDLPMITALNRRVADDVELHAEYLNNVGLIHWQGGDWREARRWLEEARDLRVARAHPVNWRSLATLQNLARLAADEKRFAEALALCREVIDAEPAPGPMRTWKELTLGKVLHAAGRPRAAYELLRRLLDTSRSSAADQVRMGIHGTLADFTLKDGDIRAAREHYDAMLAFNPQLLHRKLLDASMAMRVASFEGDEAATRIRYLELLREVEALDDPGFCLPCRYMLDYGRALESFARPREAIAVYEEMRAKLGASASKNDAAQGADASLALGAARRKLGDEAAAERELLRALAEYRALYPVAGPDHALALYELGELALTRRRRDEARAYLTEAVASYAVTAEPDYPPLVRARLALASVGTGAAE